MHERIGAGNKKIRDGRYRFVAWADYDQESEVPVPLHLTPEIEQKIAEAVHSGRFRSAEDLVETAVRELLAPAPSSPEGEFHRLRQQIEESGVPLLSDDELRREVQERRGSWA